MCGGSFGCGRSGSGGCGRSRLLSGGHGCCGCGSWW
jgi:hypothetical protein